MLEETRFFLEHRLATQLELRKRRQTGNLTPVKASNQATFVYIGSSALLNQVPFFYKTKLTNQSPAGAQLRPVAAEYIIRITLEYKVLEKGGGRSLTPFECKSFTLGIDGKMSLKSSLKRSVSYLERRKDPPRVCQAHIKYQGLNLQSVCSKEGLEGD